MGLGSGRLGLADFAWRVPGFRPTIAAMATVAFFILGARFAVIKLGRSWLCCAFVLGPAELRPALLVLPAPFAEFLRMDWLFGALVLRSAEFRFALLVLPAPFANSLGLGQSRLVCALMMSVAMIGLAVLGFFAPFAVVLQRFSANLPMAGLVFSAEA